MSLNGIDIASYQAGLDVASTPADFVIVKATQGTYYVNPTCDDNVQQTLNSGKKLGVYHYADGASSGSAEAEFFVGQIGGYIGQAMLVLDWENEALPCGPGYALEFLNRVTELTGVKPLIYMSGSVTTSYDWQCVVDADYGLWVASYYTDSLNGYNPDAPLYGVGYWQNVAMLQYTSGGYLPTWGSGLDLDVFYGNESTWDSYAGGKAVNKKQQIGVDNMQAIIRPNEEGYLEWFDGTQIHKLVHPDEVTAIQMVAQANGTTVPIIEMGTKSAPWETRFRAACLRRI